MKLAHSASGDSADTDTTPRGGVVSGGCVNGNGENASAVDSRTTTALPSVDLLKVADYCRTNRSFKCLANLSVASSLKPRCSPKNLYSVLL